MDIEFIFIGWCKEVDKTSGAVHDKVWTAFLCEGKYYAGWGARGKRMSFKHHPQKYFEGRIPLTLKEVMHKKSAGKYKEVDDFQLFAIFPDFKDSVSQQLLMKTLANMIK